MLQLERQDIWKSIWPEHQEGMVKRYSPKKSRKWAIALSDRHRDRHRYRHEEREKSSNAFRVRGPEYPEIPLLMFRI